jgi:transcriptional regulator with XRE-family HTH domain
MPDRVLLFVARRIRTLRKRSGFTQVELANKSEIARETLSKIERGNWEVGLIILARIAKALGVSLAEFFEGL